MLNGQVFSRVNVTAGVSLVQYLDQCTFSFALVIYRVFIIGAPPYLRKELGFQKLKKGGGGVNFI